VLPLQYRSKALALTWYRALTWYCSPARPLAALDVPLLVTGQQGRPSPACQQLSRARNVRAESSREESTKLGHSTKLGRTLCYRACSSAHPGCRALLSHAPLRHCACTACRVLTQVAPVCGFLSAGRCRSHKANTPPAACPPAVSYRASWSLQDIRLLRGCCARINHPCIPPARLHCPPWCHTVARLLGNIRLPFRPPVCMLYTIQYW